MGDRRAPDADRDAFPADRWTELRLESSLGHREPFVNPLGRVCPSVNPVNRQSPSALPFHSLLRAGRMHNQTAVSLMQIAVSIDRAKLRTLANLLLVEYTVSLQLRKLPAVISAERASCLTTIYKPLQAEGIFILPTARDNPSYDVYRTCITILSIFRSIGFFFPLFRAIYLRLVLHFIYVFRLLFFIPFSRVLGVLGISSSIPLRITVDCDKLSSS